jgi:eukaryotic-like serine/threonine-protein kinase
MMKQEPEELIASAMQHGKVFAERFELGEKIAEGGMSSVFKARDILLDRQIVLKLLDEERAKSGNFLQRFQDEARAGSRLSHPNIVQILNFGVSDGQPFIAMELLDGRTLQENFRLGWSLDRDRLKAVFSGVLSALVYAHEQNIIHRDLTIWNL